MLASNFVISLSHSKQVCNNSGHLVASAIRFETCLLHEAFLEHCFGISLYNSKVLDYLKGHVTFRDSNDFKTRPQMSILMIFYGR